MPSSERASISEKTPWWGEHLHRYQYVLPFIGPTEKVLDIACGNGFGSDRLASAANQGKVWGCDVSNETLAFCREKWQKPNLQFAYEDGTKLSFADNFFDTVVTFETLEHIAAYEKFVQEIKRVLKPGGKLFLSTPNILINSPSGVVTNPYHVKEFTYDELSALITSYFPDAVIYGQQFIRYRSPLSFATRLAKHVEWAMYQRGVRKLPLPIKDGVTQLLIQKNHYPSVSDYELTTDPADRLACLTFFVAATRQ